MRGVSLRPCARTVQHQIRDIFSLIDKNGDGKLSVEELAAYDSSTTTNTRPPQDGRGRAGRKGPGQRAEEGQRNAQVFLEMLHRESTINFASFDADGDGALAPRLRSNHAQNETAA